MVVGGATDGAGGVTASSTRGEVAQADARAAQTVRAIRRTVKD